MRILKKYIPEILVVNSPIIVASFACGNALRIIDVTRGATIITMPIPQLNTLNISSGVTQPIFCISLNKVGIRQESQRCNIILYNIL